MSEEIDEPWDEDQIEEWEHDRWLMMQEMGNDFFKWVHLNVLVVLVEVVAQLLYHQPSVMFPDFNLILIP